MAFEIYEKQTKKQSETLINILLEWHFELSTGPSLAQVYRCYSAFGFLEASQEKIEIWS